MTASLVVFAPGHPARAEPLPAAVGAPAPSIPAPQDLPYPGELRLAVDASDPERRIVHVHETLTGAAASPDIVLLYPKWLPGTHAPEGPIDRIAGLRVSARGIPVAWRRDALEVNAFHCAPGPGVDALDIDFDYLSPTSDKVGPIEMTPELLVLEWSSVVLYPAGFFVRRIPVQAKLVLPPGWTPATALMAHDAPGEGTGFEPVSLEDLVDSPVFAGRYSARFDLDPGGRAPVHLDLFADRPGPLEVEPAQLDAYRALVRQAVRLFGSRHYAHYDFLYSLSEELGQSGLEHSQSSENGSDPEAFTDWDRTAFDRDTLAHEFVHSWNGKFRRPAGLWTPSYELPMRDDLLWVYEGQTEYWGQVLAARAGLWTRQQFLDRLALTAAYAEHESGRSWRPLQDTTADEIINPRRPQSWPDWQRFEDYYGEGALIWLDADTLIRERSQGRHSLDDFCRAFFGIEDGRVATVTYTFDELIAALNALLPYDWVGFFHERLELPGRPAPLDGVLRGGYRLIYDETPNTLARNEEEQRKRVSLRYSLGVEVDDKDGTLLEVMWRSPAFEARLTEGAQIVAVEGAAYSGERLRDAVRRAKGTDRPIRLIVKTADRYAVVDLDYHDGLREPHLQRVAAPPAPARLEQIIAPLR